MPFCCSSFFFFSVTIAEVNMNSFFSPGCPIAQRKKSDVSRAPWFCRTTLSTQRPLELHTVSGGAKQWHGDQHATSTHRDVREAKRCVTFSFPCPCTFWPEPSFLMVRARTRGGLSPTKIVTQPLSVGHEHLHSTFMRDMRGGCWSTAPGIAVLVL